ncbi:M20 family peptidase [Aliiglaciecola sp. LCG003]|nr:M20 family peptidase [Aliiglaciecola sp. LCG003]WJG11352.1 M20 family peptidase [Aliiglaciecola sp. LCG003]
MKRLLLTFILAVMILVAVLWIRAETTFENKQLNLPQNTEQLDIDQSAAVERFAKGIRFATISYDDPSRIDDAAFAGLREHIEQSFPLIHQTAEQMIFNHHSLVYRFEGRNAALKPALFMGHMDVVPVDEVTQSQWQQPPFSGAVVDNIIWGRGTIDDKVTVFALLESMELLLSQGLVPEREIVFAFGHDEEIGGEQGAARIAEHFKQQGTEFEFVLDEGGAITDGVMAGMTQPVALIGIAEKGFVNLKLIVNDEGGHSSQPPEHTAVGILSQAIVDIENAQFETNLTFSIETFERVGYYAPLSSRLPMANLWLLSPLVESAMLGKPSSAAGIRTTIAATMLSGSSKSNILPTQASAVVNFRILPGETVETVTQHVVEAIDNPRVQIESFMQNEPSQVSPTDSLGYSLIEKNIRQLDNQILVAPYLVMGGTDSKHFYGLSDNVYRFMMVRLDPKGLKRFHGVNEQLPVADYINAITFFHAMLKQTATGQN